MHVYHLIEVPRYMDRCMVMHRNDQVDRSVRVLVTIPTIRPLPADERLVNSTQFKIFLESVYLQIMVTLAMYSY